MHLNFFFVFSSPISAATQSKLTLTKFTARVLEEVGRWDTY